MHNPVECIALKKDLEVANTKEVQNSSYQKNWWNWKNRQDSTYEDNENEVRELYSLEDSGVDYQQDR